MSFSDALTLNQYAQEVVPLEEARTKFCALPVDERRRILGLLATLLHQAHPVLEDVGSAIRQAKLQPTHTPAVLVRKGPNPTQVAKALSLPPTEYERVFRLLICFLGVADGRRRRTQCAAGCRHSWHQDLADETVVGLLKRRFDPH
jgi:hypothetical protein